MQLTNLVRNRGLLWYYIYLSGSINEVRGIVAKVNHDIAKIASWASVNGLIINDAKTQAMWVGSRGYMSRLCNLSVPSVAFDGTVVDPGESLKVLGVTLDSTLSWRAQCNVVARKTFAALSKLRKCRNFLPPDTRLMLVKSLVFPHFDLDIRKNLPTPVNSYLFTNPADHCAEKSANISARRKMFALTIHPVPPTKASPPSTTLPPLSTPTDPHTPLPANNPNRSIVIFDDSSIPNDTSRTSSSQRVSQQAPSQRRRSS
ncbi:hypothetical protein TSAR_003191 [Trichomalopsis sarcophagae]|uniref:Reverse transcriptase domain-containing protein n=1 Tax=Trichomalopsis sarcophagae TaxID=543379 RepID=A0A232FAF4_9HYME|nr:hypothetical protein TSAR_003191 [Trichomalopsis sarcophagae]